MKETTPLKYLYKIVSQEAWEESLFANRLMLSSMDSEFVHLATEQQVPDVLRKHWKGREYVILKVVPSKMTGRIIYEYNTSRTAKYYHLYEGEIPLDAVVHVHVTT